MLNQRLVVYVTEEVFHRVENAVEASDLERPDWLRAAVEAAVAKAEAPEDTANETPLHMEVEVARLTAENAGLKEVVAQARERQGMSDSLNQELAKSLEREQELVQRMTLALPAPSENGKRDWWRFWG